MVLNNNAILKQNENCFLLSIIGCIALSVYKVVNKKTLKEGDVLLKQKLSRAGVIDAPMKFIQDFGSLAGVEELPKELLNSKSFSFPSVNEKNILQKLESVENILNKHGINISFNIYILMDEKVHTKIITTDKTVSASRITSSASIMHQSQTGRLRSHETSYNLLISNEKDKQLHCSVALNIGQFIYHNEEKFYYDKDPEELAKILNVSQDCLTGETIGQGGDKKDFTGTSKRSKFSALHWANVHMCNACLTAFIKKHSYVSHIQKCVGGHVANMDFSTIPHVEHFESKEFKDTILTPIVASFDTESCQNKDITRRKTKANVIYKSDEGKLGEMILTAVVATVIIRPRRKNDFTIYKDISMSDDELLDQSTIPKEVNRFIEVEDMASLSDAVDKFRNVMNEFMALKNKI